MRASTFRVLPALFGIALGASQATAVNIDISNSTTTVTGPTTFRMENVSAMGSTYWMDLRWDSRVNKFVVANYGESAMGSFDFSETQLIDSLTANCDGNVVATVDLGPAPNALNVNMTLRVDGDKDLAVLQPDGACYHIGTGACGDAYTAGQTECINLANGPAGTYTVMVHTHSTADEVDLRYYGDNGTVNMNPALAAQKLTPAPVSNPDDNK